MTATRRLAAILAADVAGYSRLMGVDEEGTLERLKAHRRQLVDPKIREHHGRIVKTTGDGLLAEFSSVVDAVRCAAEIQRVMADRETEMAEDGRIKFRIGINLGDIIADGDDIFGDGVNVAARLEALAEPGGICISRVVRDQIRDKLPYAFEDLGEQSVKNIGRPMRVYAMSAAAVASLLPVASTVETRKPVAPSTAPRLSIVVLPFANLSNDPEQEYFADGITDDLTSDLSRISGSFVIARHTAFTYKGKPVDVKQIGRELGVRYVLEGSVRRTGDQVRVTVQLIDAETGAHVWADRFDVDRINLVEAQDAITGRLARTLNCELVADVGRRIEQENAVDPDARDLVMRGWAWFYRPCSIAGLQEAQRLFERAREIDPGSVDAMIGIARVMASRAANGLSTSLQQDVAAAEELLLEVLERDTNSSVVHFSMGMLRRTQNQLAEARIEFERAIALDRNDASAFLQLGVVLWLLGQPEAAIPHIERAIRLSPLGPNTHVNYYGLGTCHTLLGHADEAIDLLRKARAANPRIWYHHLWLAGALGLRGDLDEARAALAEGIKLKPEANSLARLRASPWGILSTGPCGKKRWPSVYVARACPKNDLAAPATVGLPRPG
jgi:TolB-like protein/class 3 adenylate cyclase/Tfp pilus assembly protein PilF